MMFERAELLLQRFRNASEEEQWRIIQSMTPLDLAALDAWFECWAHRNQLPPNGDGWRVWLMMAGRGFGKTRAGAEWIFGLASTRPGVRIARSAQNDVPIHPPARAERTRNSPVP